MFQSAVWFEILMILGLILLNGVFAMSEIALVSARKPRLRQRAEAGSRGARRALQLAGEQTRFLSTVQVGITTIGVLAGAYGGASLAAHFDVWLERYPALADYSEGIALASVVAAITFLSLIIGELVPKRIALEHPEAIASVLAGPMHAVSVAAAPVVRLLTVTTEGILRLLRLPPATEPAVTEEDVTAMVEQGTAAGIFDVEEADLVERVFRLGDRHVGSLMTPRQRIVWLDATDPVELQLDEISRHRHSRYLVAVGDVDHVVGMIRAVDLLPGFLAGTPFELEAILRQPLFVPGSLPALRLLARFRDSGIYLAVVLDEHGGVEGIVTLNDLLDEIAGELTAEADEPIVRREDGSWLVDGSLPWSDFEDELDLDTGSGSPRGYETVGGFAFQMMGRIPASGDRFRAFGLDFEIVDMDGRRIDKLLVSRAAAPERA